MPKILCWTEVGKLCHDLREEMEKSLLCLHCSPYFTTGARTWLPIEDSICWWGKAGVPLCQCLLRAARLEASFQRGHDCWSSVPYQTWDLTWQQECSSILQQLLLILHLLFARFRKTDAYESKREKHKKRQLKEETSHIQKAYSKSRLKVSMILSP